MAYKKPKLNQKVYCVYRDIIILEEARWLGEDSFITEYSSWYYDDSKCWNYDDYEITWTTTLEKAKKILRNKLGIKRLKLKEYEDYWEIDDEN